MGRYAFFLLALFVGVSTLGVAQTHSVAMGLGAAQTVPFGKVGGNSMPPFHQALTRPGWAGSFLYNYQPPQRLVGLEAALQICHTSYALRQNLPTLSHTTTTTLRPTYQVASLSVQATFAIARTPLDLYRFGQWSLLAGPHLSRLGESEFRSRSQFQGSGRVQTKVTDTFGLNAYWGWGVGAGLRFWQPLTHYRSLSYRLHWSNTFQGVRPWKASLETNGNVQTVEVPRQSLPILTLQVAYGFGMDNQRSRGE